MSPAATGPRRRRWLLLAAAVLIAVLVGGRWLALETAEHAWATTIPGGGGDAYLAARSLARLMRIVVFVVSVGWGTLHLWFIYRSIGSVQMPRRIGNLEIVEAVPQRILLAGTLLAGLAFGIGLAWGSGDWWMQALIASGAPQYGVADPILHRDVGYYVAELPWAETRQSYALLASLTAVVVVSLLYVGIGSLRFRGLRPQASPHARGHLGLLLGCLALVLAWGALLDPAEFVAGLHGAVVHPVIDVRIPGDGVVAVLAIATAIVSVAWAWWDRPHAVSAAWAVLIAAQVTVYGLVPGLGRGGPRTGRAADTTFAADRRALERLAFGAEGLSLQPADSAPRLVRGPAGIPVWDASRVAAVVARSGRLERGRTVAGVALAPDLAGGALAWLVATAPDDTALARADPPPDWTAVHRGAWARAGPPLAAVETDTGLATRDVPFRGAATWFGPGFSQYAVLPGAVAGGPRGIELDGTWQRVALAWALQSPELLRQESRGGVLLWRRGATERLARLAPFAAFEAATPVLADSALWWVTWGHLDADYFPLVEPLHAGDRLVRYHRAAVLGAVNAVSGETRLWLAPGHDSLAAAWGRAFRGLVAPPESIPPWLRGRLAYPADGVRLAAAVFARAEQDTTAWKPLTPEPYAVIAAGSGGDRGADAVWRAQAFSEGGRLQAIVAGVMAEPGPRLFAWRRSLPDSLPAILVGTSETRPGVPRAWFAAGRVLIVQARFAEPESRTPGGRADAAPRIESVFITWGDRNGEGRSVAAALRDLLASSPLGAAGDTSVAARWRAARSLAAEMDAALARRDVEEFGRLYRRLLESLGVPRPKLAPRP